MDRGTEEPERVTMDGGMPFGRAWRPGPRRPVAFLPLKVVGAESAFDCAPFLVIHSKRILRISLHQRARLRELLHGLPLIAVFAPQSRRADLGIPKISTKPTSSLTRDQARLADVEQYG